MIPALLRWIERVHYWWVIQDDPAYAKSIIYDKIVDWNEALTTVVLTWLEVRVKAGMFQSWYAALGEAIVQLSELIG